MTKSGIPEGMPRQIKFEGPSMKEEEAKFKKGGHGDVIYSMGSIVNNITLMLYGERW